MRPWKKVLQSVSPSWQAAGLTWLWVAFLHPDVFFRPNSILLSSSRDAVKNIYTLAWQWAHGGAFSSEFTGMGWPFTEHVFYTDGHPLLAWLTGGWLVPDILPATWTVGLLHGAIIASWGVAAALLVRIFHYYGVRGAGAVLASSFIALSHPQILRWTGHYAMAYTVALPLTWWLQLQWQANPTWKNTWKQSINILAWLLTHAYLGSITAAFAGLSGGFHWLANKERTRREIACLVFAAASPLAGYMALLAATDTHPFRTDRPFGFWDNVSRWNAAALPSHGPLGKLRIDWGWGLTTWEGWGFLGTGVWVALVMGLGAVAVRGILFRTQPRLSLSGPWSALAASVVLYAVAVGEPFLTGKDAWLEEAKLFMQFRAIGRFTWPAVWAFPVFAIWWARQNKLWMGVVVVCFAFDAFWMQREARVQMNPTPNGFHVASPQLSHLSALAKTHRALAIHPVPWFQMGSESVGREGTQRAHRNTLEASFHTGLPSTATHLTRMSISESRTLTEWMGPGASAQRLQSAIGEWPERATILLYACDDTSTWLPDDHRIWQAGTPTSESNVRILSLEAFFAQPRSTRSEQPNDWHWNGLNRSPFSEALEGMGIARGRQNEYLIADTIRPDSAWIGRSIEASCWFWHGSEHAGREALQFEWVCEAEWPNGSRGWIEHVPVAACGEHAGDWTRAAVNVHLKALPDRLYFFAVGFESDGDSIYADAFCVKPLPL